MTNDEILDVVRRCDLKKGTEIIPYQAYHFHRKFRVTFQSINRSIYENMELIVLARNLHKVGGIFRLGWESVYCVLYEEYRNQHILSNFFRSGEMKYLWPENKTMLIYNDGTDEYNKLMHLAELSGLEAITTKEPVFRSIHKYFNL